MIARRLFRFSAPRPATLLLFQLPPRSGKRTLAQPYPYRLAIKRVAYEAIIDIFYSFVKVFFENRVKIEKEPDTKVPKKA
jgi:hypothetical protein